MTSIIFCIAFPISKYIIIDRSFDREVHGHVVNAYYSNTPELMIDELTQAINGLDNLSVSSEDYGAFFSWDKTPDKRVDYWLKHFDSIITRCYSVIDWRDSAYSNGSTPESLGDVYEQKMLNIRNFIKFEKDDEVSWSDEVFRDAYTIKHYPWGRFATLIEICCGIIPLILLILATIISWQMVND